MEEAGGSGIEMEEITRRGPSRQSSLESQRQRRPSPWNLWRFTGRPSLPWIPWWLLPGESSVVPQPSRQVHDAIKAGAKAYRSDARHFINEFDRMSHFPNFRVEEILDIFIRLGDVETESEGTNGMRYHHVYLQLATDHC